MINLLKALARISQLRISIKSTDEPSASGIRILRHTVATVQIGTGQEQHGILIAAISAALHERDGFADVLVDAIAGVVVDGEIIVCREMPKSGSLLQQLIGPSNISAHTGTIHVAKSKHIQPTGRAQIRRAGIAGHSFGATALDTQALLIAHTEVKQSVGIIASSSFLEQMHAVFSIEAHIGFPGQVEDAEPTESAGVLLSHGFSEPGNTLLALSLIKQEHPQPELRIGIPLLRSAEKRRRVLFVNAFGQLQSHIIILTDFTRQGKQIIQEGTY